MTVTELAAEYARYTTAAEFGNDVPTAVLPITTITGSRKG